MKKALLIALLLLTACVQLPAQTAGDLVQVTYGEDGFTEHYLSPEDGISFLLGLDAAKDPQKFRLGLGMAISGGALTLFPAWSQLTDLPASITDLADGSLSGSLVGSGINGANLSEGTVPLSALPASGGQVILAVPFGGGSPSYLSASAVLDFVTSGPGLAQGSIMIRRSTGWNTLTPGASGTVLKGQGTSSLPIYGAVSLTSDVTGTLPLTRGGLGATTASGARTALGLEIGTNVQAYDADLDDLADGSLSGSKVGSGIAAGNITTGTINAARLPAFVGGVTGGTDNALLRADGAGGSTAQGSGVTVADDGTLTSPNGVLVSTVADPATGMEFYVNSGNPTWPSNDAKFFRWTVDINGAKTEIMKLFAIDATSWQLRGSFSLAPTGLYSGSGFGGTITVDRATIQFVQYGSAVDLKKIGNDQAFRFQNDILDAYSSGQPAYLFGTINTLATTRLAVFANNGVEKAIIHADGFVEDSFRHRGTGSPEGVVTAPVGATYHRTDGGASTSFYVKESGAGNTGWAAK